MSSAVVAEGWWGGSAAALEGLSIADCPYAPGDPEGSEWRRGWLDTQSRILADRGEYGQTQEQHAAVGVTGRTAGKGYADDIADGWEDHWSITWHSFVDRIFAGKDNLSFLTGLQTVSQGFTHSFTASRSFCPPPSRRYLLTDEVEELLKPYRRYEARSLPNPPEPPPVTVTTKAAPICRSHAAPMHGGRCRFCERTFK